MSEKSVRKFEKLRAAYREARDARKAASIATREVRGLNGEALSLAALGSKAGAKAVQAELAALREERRTLKKLAGYAARHAETGRAPSNGAKAPATSRGNRSAGAGSRSGAKPRKSRGAKVEKAETET